MPTLAIRIERPTANGHGPLPSGRIEFKPLASRSVLDESAGMYWLTDEPMNVSLTSGMAEVEFETVDAGKPFRARESWSSREFYFLAPVTDLDYSELVEVDPASLESNAALDAAWVAYTEQLTQEFQDAAALIGAADGSANQAAAAAALALTRANTAGVAKDDAITARNAAQASLASATAQAVAAASSNTSATAQATLAGTKATAAGVSATAALNSAAAASASATSASGSATLANTSRNQAAAAASAADTSAALANTRVSQAASHASTAAAQAVAALAAQAAAESAKVAAGASSTSASASASSASALASTATTKASEASASAAAAAASAAEAAASAGSGGGGSGPRTAFIQVDEYGASGWCPEIYQDWILTRVGFIRPTGVAAQTIRHQHVSNYKADTVSSTVLGSMPSIEALDPGPQTHASYTFEISPPVVMGNARSVINNNGFYAHWYELTEPE